jgi:glycosyltransferase involved in cell wall biosynthesis
MRARLTFVTSALTIGGAERQWAILLPGLRELGFEVRLMTLLDEGPFFDELRANGIAAECVRLSRRTDVSGFRRVFHFVERGTDLLVSQNVNAQVVGALAARKAGIPHVTIDHTPPGISFRRYQRLLVRFAVRNAVVVIAVSSGQIEPLVGLGIRRERIVIIPNGVDERLPSRRREEVREELAIADGDFVALLVADLRPQKEAEVFVDAVTRAHAQDARVTGLVAGAGPELARVSAAAEASAGAVRVLGARLDVPDLMHAADVVCLTSATEGLPMVLLEAMSLGRAVVATAVDGVTDVVIPDETGLLVSRGDVDAFAKALVLLKQNPSLQDELGHGGRARYRDRFTARRMTEDYAAVFERALGSGRKGRRR